MDPTEMSSAPRMMTMVCTTARSPTIEIAVPMTLRLPTVKNSGFWQPDDQDDQQDREQERDVLHADGVNRAPERGRLRLRRFLGDLGRRAFRDSHRAVLPCGAHAATSSSMASAKIFSSVAELRGSSPVMRPWFMT